MPDGPFTHALRVPAEDRPEHRVRCGAQLAERGDARGLDALAELAAEAGQAAYRERIEHGVQVVGGHRQ